MISKTREQRRESGIGKQMNENTGEIQDQFHHMQGTATCGTTIIDGTKKFYTLDININYDKIEHIMRTELLNDTNINSKFGNNSPNTKNDVYTYVLCKIGKDDPIYKMFFIKVNSIEEYDSKHASIMKMIYLKVSSETDIDTDIPELSVVIAGEMMFNKTDTKSVLSFNVASGTFMESRDINNNAIIDIFIEHIRTHLTNNTTLTFTFTSFSDSYITPDFQADIKYLTDKCKLFDGNIQLFDNQNDCKIYSSWKKRINYTNVIAQRNRTQLIKAKENLKTAITVQEKSRAPGQVQLYKQNVMRYDGILAELKRNSPKVMGVSICNDELTGGKSRRRRTTKKRRKTLHTKKRRKTLHTKKRRKTLHTKKRRKTLHTKKR